MIEAHGVRQYAGQNGRRCPFPALHHAARARVRLCQRQRRGRPPRRDRRARRGQRRPRTGLRQRPSGRRKPPLASATCSAPTVEAFLVWNGTGANVMALASMVQPADSIVCTELGAHRRRRDRCAGADHSARSCSTSPAPTAKLVPEQLEHLAHLQGVQHHAQPGRRVSITQSTELGTVYTADEMAALCDTAHRMGMLVHLDGARIANATAALGGTVAALRSFTVDAGRRRRQLRRHEERGWSAARPSSTSTRTLAKRAMFVRKQVNQLPSKMRFVAAQFNALLHDELWIRSAEHSNAMATRLYELTHDIPGVAVRPRPPGEQPVSRSSRGCDRSAVRLVLLLGLGCQPWPGALDDRLGHHGGRRRPLRRGRPASSFLKFRKRSLRERFDHVSCDYLLSASTSPA